MDSLSEQLLPAGDAVVTPLRNAVVPTSGLEVFPGYVLREKIGAGGYGEVWSADAPGGLTKAIKFVFGSLGDVRAMRELKSLNRVRHVQHPFLLSLERIEIVNGQLIILTELADSCLKTRFEACRQNGLVGIPRDELLQHLSDTADALDYLGEQHSLQHLDVKPENLLLVGNRVKVADFGLLKDLNETNVSLVGGLTPLYSPPEVFDGRPNRSSDQYSLAIVYQDLLTGEPPFRGRTTAQLAAQHLSSPPMLSPLPVAEQPIVARALSKDPEKRFSTCRDFVAALRSPTSGRLTGKSAPSPPPAAVTPVPAECTQVIGEVDIGEARSTRVLAEPQTIKSLPPLELTDDDLVFRPTIFIGLGGTAGRVLSKVRRQLCDRFGNVAELPAFQLLCIDSDLKALHSLANGESGAELPLRDTLGVPLRKPQDYREARNQLQEWLSRRWLYNIPRSLQTEGMRPLGRLAAVDHAAAIQKRLQSAIDVAMDEDGLAESARRTGLPFVGGTPRLYLIASLNGGFGSGALVDVAYWTRALLADRGISDRCLAGILTHATPRKADDRDLAVANAVSCLDEVQHFSAYGQQFPADVNCGVPSFEEDNATLRDLYVVHLGDELTTDSLELALNGVAEYVTRSVSTNAAAFHDKARLAERESIHNPLGERRVRSFGIRHFGPMQSDVPRSAVDRLCREITAIWSGVSYVSDDHDAARFADARQATNGKTTQSGRAANVDVQLCNLVQQANDIVDQFCDQQRDRLLRKITQEAIRQWTGASLEIRDGTKLFQRLDRMITGMRRADPQGATSYLRSELEDDLSGIVNTKIAVIRESIFGLIDTPYERVPAAQRASRWFVTQVEALERDNDRVCNRLADELAQFRERFCEFVRTHDSRLADEATRTGSLGLGQFDMFCYARLQSVFTIHASLRPAILQLQSAARHVNASVDKIADQLSSFAGSFDAAPSTGSRDVVNEMIRHELFDLGVDLEQELAAKYFSASRMLSHVLKEGEAGLKDLAINMRSAARRVISTRVRAAASQRVVRDASNTEVVQRGLREAMPDFAQYGGDYRLLISAGSPDLLDELQEAIKQAANVGATTLCEADDDVRLCYEVENIPLATLVHGLIGNRHDCAKLASRLHTRKDVEWTSMLPEAYYV